MPSVGSVTCVKCRSVSSAACLYQQGVFQGLLRRSDPLFSSSVISFFTKLVVYFEVYANITHVCTGTGSLASAAFQISVCPRIMVDENAAPSMSIMTIAITMSSSSRLCVRGVPAPRSLPSRNSSYTWLSTQLWPRSTHWR